MECVKCGADMKMENDGSYVCSRYPFCSCRVYPILSVGLNGHCDNCGKKYEPLNNSDKYCPKCKEALRKKYRPDHEVSSNPHNARYIEGRCAGVFGDGLNRDGDKCPEIINVAFRKTKCSTCRDAYHNWRRKNKDFPWMKKQAAMNE